jgi:predicted nuclease of predicted toxin-antitoxin system
MKFKLDENLPLQIAATLRILGHDIHTTADEGLTGCNDADLWRAAQGEERILITQDLDFSDARQFAPGTHHGLVLVRLREPSRIRLAEHLAEALRNEDIEAWTRCFVVVTDQKVRVRRASN